MDLEPSQHQYVFDAIEKDLAVIKQCKKKLSIVVVYKYRASPSQSSLPRYVLEMPPVNLGALSVPPYYAQGKPNDGAYNHGDHANFGHPGTRKAFAELLHALALRYDKDPAVSFLQFSETAIGADISADLQSNFIDGVMGMNRDARAEFVHTPLIQSINFPRSRLSDFVANFTSLKMGFGGPDVFVDSLSTPSNALGFESPKNPGVYHYNFRNNGNLPIAMQVHHENLLYATRELQLEGKEHHLPPEEAVQRVYRFAVEKLRANYIVWQVFGPSEVYRKIVEANLRSAAMPVLTQCPLVYQGSCRSSSQ